MNIGAVINFETDDKKRTWGAYLSLRFQSVAQPVFHGLSYRDGCR